MAHDGETAVRAESAVRVAVSDPWKRLILFCQNELPEGELRVKIVNGSPTELLEARRRVRFDKPLPHFSGDLIEPAP